MAYRRGRVQCPPQKRRLCMPLAGNGRGISRYFAIAPAAGPRGVLCTCAAYSFHSRIPVSHHQPEAAGPQQPARVRKRGLRFCLVRLVSLGTTPYASTGTTFDKKTEIKGPAPHDMRRLHGQADIPVVPVVITMTPAEMRMRRTQAEARCRFHQENARSRSRVLAASTRAGPGLQWQRGCACDNWPIWHAHTRACIYAKPRSGGGHESASASYT